MPGNAGLESCPGEGSGCVGLCVFLVFFHESGSVVAVCSACCSGWQSKFSGGGDASMSTKDIAVINAQVIGHLKTFMGVLAQQFQDDRLGVCV